ncbi:MAG TPA: TlpA disulfide reductase family protein [Planctomycetaceae bacterium]|jgi:thiol-disulfide isomerase/thioredoxin
MRKLVLAIGVILVATQLTAPCLQASEQDESKKIMALVQAQKVAEAEEAFQAALKEYPDSPAINGLHVQLYYAYLRAGKTAEGATHAVANLDYQLQLLAKDPPIVFGLPNAAIMVGFALNNSGKGDLGIEKFDATLAAVEARIEDGARPELTNALRDLRSNKIMLLVNTGKAAAAAKLVQTELAAATKEFEEAPDDALRAVRLSNVLQFEMNVAAQTAPDTVGKLRADYTDFVAGQIKKHPDSLPLVSAYNSVAMQAIREVMSSNADEAQKRLDDWKAFLDSLDTSATPMKNFVANARRTVTSYENSLAAERKRAELIGKPAIPLLGVEDWVNGDPISDAELKGKVVLLDFWAVWCGPCIATFPHLREWNEKYAAKGLVIVGVTKYYKHEWDDEAKRTKQTQTPAEFTAAQEQETLVKFAEHHMLKHRFAVMSNTSGFDKEYGVTGIPQAVLIDRTGAVRMIRVGSGDKNAHDLDTLLEELFRDGAAGAAKEK